MNGCSGFTRTQTIPTLTWWLRCGEKRKGISYSSRKLTCENCEQHSPKRPENRASCWRLHPEPSEASDEKGNAKGTFRATLRGRAAQDIAEALVRVVGVERQRALRNIVLAWVLTIPASAAVAALVWFPVKAIF